MSSNDVFHYQLIDVNILGCKLANLGGQKWGFGGIAGSRYSKVRFRPLTAFLWWELVFTWIWMLLNRPRKYHLCETLFLFEKRCRVCNGSNFPCFQDGSHLFLYHCASTQCAAWYRIMMSKRKSGTSTKNVLCTSRTDNDKKSAGNACLLCCLQLIKIPNASC